MEREKKQFFFQFSTHVTTRRPTPPTDVTARVSFSLVSNIVAVASLLLISRKKGASNVDDATTTEYQTKAMKLYGLAYQLHLNIQQQKHEHEDYDEEGSAGGTLAGSSLRLTLIIANNITDLHRRAGNTIKQQLCLEHFA